MHPVTAKLHVASLVRVRQSLRSVLSVEVLATAKLLFSVMVGLLMVGIPRVIGPLRSV